MHVATVPLAEVVAVGLPQRVEPGVAILGANPAVLVATVVAETPITLPSILYPPAEQTRSPLSGIAVAIDDEKRSSKWASMLSANLP
jgi:hypothetical protein